MYVTIYILTLAFMVYVVYVAEGDSIVAFIHEVFSIDLTHPHTSLMRVVNYIHSLPIFKWRLPI